GPVDEVQPLLVGEGEEVRWVQRVQVDAGVALEDELQLVEVDDRRDREGEREGGQRQVDAGQPQRREPEEEAEEAGQQRGQRNRRIKDGRAVDAERVLQVVGGQRGGVAADGHEGAVPQ